MEYVFAFFFQVFLDFNDLEIEYTDILMIYIHGS